MVSVEVGYQAMQSSQPSFCCLSMVEPLSFWKPKFPFDTQSLLSQEKLASPLSESGQCVTSPRAVCPLCFSSNPIQQMLTGGLVYARYFPDASTGIKGFLFLPISSINEQVGKSVFVLQVTPDSALQFSRSGVQQSPWTAAHPCAPGHPAPVPFFLSLGPQNHHTLTHFSILNLIFSFPWSLRKSGIQVNFWLQIPLSFS